MDNSGPQMFVRLDPFKEYLLRAAGNGVNDVTFTSMGTPILHRKGRPIINDVGYNVRPFELDALIFYCLGIEEVNNLRDGLVTRPLTFTFNIDGIGDCRCSAISMPLGQKSYIVTIRLR